MGKQLFTGTGTAIVTPFKEDLSIDFEAFEKLLDFQIENGVEAIVVCGSTGESATLSAKEKVSLIVKAVEHVNGRVPVIAGTGSNNTRASIDLSLIAKEQGASGVLLVAPYYNKPSQAGLYQHYLAISENVDIPQIIYNVPGRSGVNILPETQLRLAEDAENIVATKEASGDLEQIMEIIKYSPEGFSVYSGDDPLAVPISLMGGDGVISVISNYVPKKYSDAVRAAVAGKRDEAIKLQYELLDLMAINFIETNPIPVKAALALMGKIEENYRLPLIPLRPENKEKLKQALKDSGVL